MKSNEKCSNIVETSEIVQEEVVDHVQAVVLIDKDGQQFFKLDDGRLMPVVDTIETYTIEENGDSTSNVGNSKVFITE